MFQHGSPASPSARGAEHDGGQLDWAHEVSEQRKSISSRELQVLITNTKIHPLQVIIYLVTIRVQIDFIIILKGIPSSEFIVTCVR